MARVVLALCLAHAAVVDALGYGVPEKNPLATVVFSLGVSGTTVEDVLANQDPWQQIGADFAGAGVMPEDVVVRANPGARRLDEAGPGFARALLDEAKDGAQRRLQGPSVVVDLEINVKASKVEEVEKNLGDATPVGIQEALDDKFQVAEISSPIILIGAMNYWKEYNDKSPLK